jgi:hypothetical protein
MAKRLGSGRKPGGQKGHRGSYRELLAPELVDTFVDLFPEVCLGCACTLPRVVDVAACRYQQLELRDHRFSTRASSIPMPRAGGAVAS